MCVGQLGSLLPHVVVPSILAAFLIPEWHLSGAQAGLLAGSGAAGYMVTVPLLATLTDRIDARRILIACRRGYDHAWRRCWFRAGIALPACGPAHFQRHRRYRLCGSLHARPQGADRPPVTRRFVAGVTLYTSSFSVGVGFRSWSRNSSRKLGLADGVPGDGGGTAGNAVGLPSLRPVSQNPRKAVCWISRRCSATPAMVFVLGYGAHCFELYGIRTWLVASGPTSRSNIRRPRILTPVVVSVLFSLLAMPASILGNECALQFGRGIAPSRR